MNTTPPVRPADLEGGLRRLKLASMRRLAGFPVTKTLDTFDVSVSSIPAATVNYLASGSEVAGFGTEEARQPGVVGSWLTLRQIPPASWGTRGAGPSALGLCGYT